MRYLPFIIISIILYILFFYHSQQSELLPSRSSASEAINDKIIALDFKKIAQQDKQQISPPAVQSIKIAPSKEEEMPVAAAVQLTTDPAIETNNHKQAAIESETVTDTPKQVAGSVLAATTKVSPQLTEKALLDNSKIAPNAVDNALQKNTSNTISPQKNNSVKYLLASIKATPASDAALLKAENYEQYFYVDFPPAPNKQTEQQTQQQTQQQAITDDLNKKEATTIVKSPNQTTVSEVNKNTKRSFKKQVKPSHTLNENKGLQEAIAISGNKPDYPSRATKGNLQGEVSIKFTVNMRGYSKNPQVISSSGHKELDNAVLDFINKERFMPALEGIEKVTSEQQYSFSYK